MRRPVIAAGEKEGGYLLYFFGNYTQREIGEIYGYGKNTVYDTTYTVPYRSCRRKWRCFYMGSPNLVPYETIVLAISGEPEAVDKV